MLFAKRKKIRLGISNFWKNFREVEIYNDYLFKLLFKNFDVELSDEPNLLFFSVFPDIYRNHSEYNCLKVFYTGENVKPDYNICDYSFSFEETNKKNFQLPNFVRHPFFQEFRKKENIKEINSLKNFPKTKFCNFVYSNKNANERIRFCQKLMCYKPVDCPSKVLNNIPSIGSGWNNKLNFIKEYKFTIAFENTYEKYYTTEKIYHPFIVGSIPIYWGNPEVQKFFNPDSFIKCDEFHNFDEVIERIIEIDNNDFLYRKYLDTYPVQKESILYKNFTEKAILERLDNIISNLV